MIACYLVYSKICPDADTALTLFAERRTQDGRGVASPSQIRYVNYVSQYMTADNNDRPSSIAHGRRLSMPNSDYVRAEKAHPMYLMSVRIHGIPYQIRSESAQVWFVVSSPPENSSPFSSRKLVKPVRFLDSATDAIVFPVPRGEKSAVKVEEDAHIEFFFGSVLFKKSMFQFWFNTRFVGCDENNPKNLRLILSKNEIDEAKKDKDNKLFPQKMTVELLFSSNVSGI